MSPNGVVLVSSRLLDTLSGYPLDAFYMLDALSLFEVSLLKTEGV